MAKPPWSWMASTVSQADMPGRTSWGVHRPMMWPDLLSTSWPTMTSTGMPSSTAIRAASRPPAFELWSVMAMTARSVSSRTHSRISRGVAVPSDAVECMWRSAADHASSVMVGTSYRMGTAARDRTWPELACDALAAARGSLPGHPGADRKRPPRATRPCSATVTTADFDYDLPSGLIAQSPAEPRDSCRLLVVDRGSGQIDHRKFSDLGEYLDPGDLLVVNETRVLPARLKGVKDGSGGAAEVLLLRES